MRIEQLCAGHPLVGHMCPACGEPFKEDGQARMISVGTPVPIGPVGTLQAAIPVHRGCADRAVMSLDDHVC